MTDKTYRKQVEADFSARPDNVVGNIAIFDKTGQDLYNGDILSQEEREALTFLYAYMPLADAVDYPAEYFLDQVRASFRIREEMGWNVPEREFRHFVLPIRVNNETWIRPAWSSTANSSRGFRDCRWRRPSWK
jgi:hypothetical protein